MATAAKRKLTVVPRPVIETKYAVIAYPDGENGSPITLTPHQRENLKHMLDALDREGPKGGKAVVFCPPASRAQVYATYTATHLSAELVECAGHSGDTCTCIEDYDGEYHRIIIVESKDKAREVTSMLGERAKREPDHPKRFGTALLFLV